MMLVISCKPANPRTRGREQSQFRSCQVAGSNEQHHAALKIQKYRQSRIPDSLPQLPGLTGIIFYICLIQRPQRENYFFSIAAQL